MEAVSNLHSVWGGPPRCFGVLSASISAHHFHPWMLTEPVDEAIRAPVRQDVYQRATLEIHQYRPVAGSPAESEVVHAQDPRRSVGSEP